MALSVQQVARKYAALKKQYQDRDTRMYRVLAVREGRMVEVYPDLFPEGMPAPMVANFVDVVARDLSELLAPLPSFNCATLKNTDKAKKNADVRTQIVNNYVYQSRLESQMYSAADWYLSYGFLPIVVEPDFQNNMPRIRVENPLGAYPEYDRHGRIISYTKRYMKTIRELVNEFPEYESQIIGRQGCGPPQADFP